MPLRIGIVGLCTSHPEKWIPLLRNMRMGRSGTPEIAAVWDSGDVRPAGYAAEFARTFEITRCVRNLDEMIDLVDVAIIHSVNWDRHIEQAAPFIEANKSVLIDKPLVGHFGDAGRLMEWAAAGNRIIGGSSLRFARELSEYRRMKGSPRSAFAICGTDEFGYGIHGYAMLCGLMGDGVVSVRHLGGTPSVVELRWADGRTGIVVLDAGRKLPFQLTALNDAGLSEIAIDVPAAFAAFLNACVPYLAGDTDESPLPAKAMLEPELAALAALQSLRRSGAEVELGRLDQASAAYDGNEYTTAYRDSRTR